MNHKIRIYLKNNEIKSYMVVPNDKATEYVHVKLLKELENENEQLKKELTKKINEIDFLKEQITDINKYNNKLKKELKTEKSKNIFGKEK